MAQILFIPFAGSGGGSQQDHFAPKYVVGNTPAGDTPLAYSMGGFNYIPDPGDGSGIALALAQSAGPGDIWIRPGTYTKTQARFVVPDGIRVWGAGIELTVIVGSDADNCVWEIGSRSELAWLRCNHPGVVAGVGEELVRVVAETSYVHDLIVDASEASAGGVLIAGIQYAGGGAGNGPILSRLYNNVIVGPPGSGSADPLVMYANVRGSLGGGSDSIVVDCASNTIIGGDAGFVSLGNTGVNPAQGMSFMIGRTVVMGPAVIGFYFDYSPMLIAGPAVVLAFDPTSLIGGAIVLNTFQYEFGDVLLLNLTGSATVPGIFVSEPTPVPNDLPTSVNIHDCTFLFWGDPADPNVPQVLLGQVATPELVRSARVIGNRFISNPGVTPVLLGVGCSNTIVAMNTGDDFSGGAPVIDLGALNEVAHNLWS